MATGATGSPEEIRALRAGRPLRTLLTGFGSFGAVVSNPTERLVRAFETKRVAGHTLTTRVFDVSYARASRGISEVLLAGDEPPFDVVLMLGVAANRSWWSVERSGANRNGSVPDVEGVAFPDHPIRAEGPDSLLTTLPVDSLVDAIKAAGLPASPSDSAGAFLCNHLLYETLFLLQGPHGVTRAGFLHVPPDDQTMQAGWTGATPTFRFSDQRNALEAVLGALTRDDDPSQ